MSPKSSSILLLFCSKKIIKLLQIQCSITEELLSPTTKNLKWRIRISMVKWRLTTVVLSHPSLLSVRKVIKVEPLAVKPLAVLRQTSTWLRLCEAFSHNYDLLAGQTRPGCASLHPIEYCPFKNYFADYFCAVALRHSHFPSFSVPKLQPVTVGNLCFEHMWARSHVGQVMWCQSGVIQAAGPSINPPLLGRRERPLSPRSSSWMKHSALPTNRLCLCWGRHTSYLTLCKSHISCVVMDISSDIAAPTLTRCNNGNVVALARWLLQVLSRTFKSTRPRAK